MCTSLIKTHLGMSVGSAETSLYTLHTA